MTSQPYRAPRQRTRLLGLAGLLAVVGVVGACGSDESSGSSESTAASSATVAVEKPWSRTTPSGATTGAAYMLLESAGGDRLIGASVAPDIAAKVELHETVAAGGDGTTASSPDTMHDAVGSSAEGSMGSAEMGDDSMGGMTMRPVEGIDLPAGQQVQLEPGGYHVMLLDLAAPLAAGSTYQLTLQFEHGGTVKVDVPVQDSAP